MFRTEESRRTAPSIIFLRHQPKVSRFCGDASLWAWRRENKIAINFLNINKYLCHLLHSSKGPSRFRLAGGPSYPASHAAYRVRQVIAELVM
jgi:hypothetical protein